MAIKSLTQPTTTRGKDGRRQHLRPIQTPLRRSPRLHAQTANAASTIISKPQPSSKNKKARKPSQARSRLQSPTISPNPHEANLSTGNRRPLRQIEASQARRRSPRLAAAEIKRKEAVVAAETVENGVNLLDEEKEEAGLVALAKEEGPKKMRETEMTGIEEGKENREPEPGRCCGSAEEWTNEQDIVLRKAYLLAKPSPHFWKKVSRMVPGKSSQECFNRVHAKLPTPPQHEPRSRTRRIKYSPVGKFPFLDENMKPKSKIMVRSSKKKKSLVAHKTVRHLLRKHCSMDRSEEADFFSVLETSPNALGLESSGIKLSGTPDCIRSPSGSLFKCSERSSSAQNKLLSRFKTNQTNHPSPEVLKRIKNTALHEKYIDLLHGREARRACHKSKSSMDTRNPKINNGMEAGVVKAASAALITEAREAISHFQHVQANCLNDDQCSDMDSMIADSDTCGDVDND